MNKIVRVACFDPNVFEFDDKFQPKRHEEFIVYGVNGRYVLNSKDGYFEISKYEFDLGFYKIDEKPFVPYFEEYNSRRKRKVEPSWNNISKSVREAEEWAKRYLNVGHVDYTGFDPRIASEINFQLWKLQRFYPEIPQLKWLSSSRVLYRANFEQKLLSSEPHFKRMREKRNSNVWAWSFSESWGDQQGIAFNAKFVKDYNVFRQKTTHAAKIGWHPPNCNEINHIITHEFAHQIDDFLRREGLRDECIDPLWQKYRENAKSVLSQYAATNSKEFFAEAFAEFIHGDYDERGGFVCRPVAFEVIDNLNITLDKYRKNKGLSRDWGRNSGLPQFA